MSRAFLYHNFVFTKKKDMKMKMQIHPSLWGIRSVSFWSVLILALGIIYIGVRFITHPETGAQGYGIAFQNAGDIAYGKIKGIRDIVSGLVLLPLLWMRMRKAVAWVFSIATLVPVCDFLIILHYNGSHDIAHLLVHGLTAAVMVITSILLFYGISTSPKN
ncbi:MAG: DUF4267 domain-containing protein [Sphingobacteriales bacterium]|nr:MAG: DUF4267 domain-containing protein [Sphingobacteriales bacterium]